jgi:hypothetical protein
VIECLLADFLAEYDRRHPLVEVELKEAGGVSSGICSIVATSKWRSCLQVMRAWRDEHSIQ